MKTAFGVKPENIFAYLCPAATINTYTVDASIAEHWPNEFKKKFNDAQIQNLNPQIQNIVLKYSQQSPSKITYLLNIPRRIYQELILSGVKATNIENSNIDTISNPQFHSNRRDPKNFGLGLGFICMN